MLMIDLAKKKYEAQKSRCAALIDRLRVLEVSKVQEHIEEQFSALLSQAHYVGKSTDNYTAAVSQCFNYDRPINRTDYDNSLIDIIQEEFKKEKGENDPLSSPEILAFQRWLFHKKLKEQVKSSTQVLNQAIKDALPDDAETDSSTEDEMEAEQPLYKVTSKNKMRKYKPVDTTPVARWAKFRSNCISAWSWLDHAIDETEYRFRKQDALYVQMRKSKPRFTFDKLEKPKTYSSIPLPDVEGVKFYHNPSEAVKFNVIRAHSLELLADTAVNQRESLKREQNIQTKDGRQFKLISSKDDTSALSSRCRPLKLCRPRKIYKVDGIKYFMDPDHISITNECGCSHGDSCLICLGDRHAPYPTGPIDDTWEEISYLDHTYHTSLSLPEEVPVDFLIQKELREREVRGRFLCDSPKLKKFYSTGSVEPDPIESPEKEREMPTPDTPETIKRGRGRPRVRPFKTTSQSKKSEANKQYKKKAYKKRKAYSTRKSGAYSRDLSEDDRSYNTTPTTSIKRTSYSRKRPDFDINNIVIPYQVSATTRVEKLEYKEIITPTFRLMEFKPSYGQDAPRPPKRAGVKRGKRFLHKVDDDYEDLDDDIIKARHERCEADERRKFSTFFNKQSTRRRRMESKTESPDAGGEVSEVPNVSPPSAPRTPDSYYNDEGHVQVLSSEEASMAASALKVGIGRRRTISSTKKEEEDPDECYVLPYSPRGFPLMDSMYEEMRKDMPDGFFDGIKT